MKPITLHPVSVLVGVALVGLAVFLTGAQQPVVARHVPPDLQVCGEIPAEWWTFVQLNNGLPPQTFTVPPDRYFVVTQVQADGVVSYTGGNVNELLGLYNESENLGNGSRVAIPPGSSVSVGGIGGYRTADVWGYLEPVR